MLRAEIYRPSELGPDELRQWDSLQVDAGLCEPFKSAEFAVAAEAVFPAIRVAIVHDGPDLVGYLPFRAERFRRATSMVKAGLDMFIPTGVPWTLRDVMRAARIDLLEFSHQLASQLGPAGSVAATHMMVNADLTQGYDHYLAAVRDSGGGFIKTAERKRRSLERNDPDVRFVFDTQDPVALGQLLDWKSAHVRRAGGYDNLTLLRGFREHIEHVCTLDTPGVRGSVSLLYSGERLLAGTIDLRQARLLSLWTTSYDPEVASLSPGRTCMLNVIEAAAGAGIEKYCFGAGDLDYKRRLSNEEIPLVALTAGRPSLGTRCSRQATALEFKARHIAAKLLRRERAA